MDSDVSSIASVPEIPPDSPGSSVSTRLQEEYEELLKYAVVVPTFDSSPTVSNIVLNNKPFQTTETEEQHVTMLTLSQTQEQTVTKSQNSTEDITSRISRSDRSVQQQQSLPNLDPSPITSNQYSQYSSDGSATDTLEKPDDMERENIPSYRKHFAWQGPGHSSYQTIDVEFDKDEDNNIYTATLDPDVSKMANLLDQWSLDLKRNIMAEFGQSKIRIVENGRQELLREQEKHSCERNKLVNEIDSLKELLHTYEQSMERKDQVISNLTHAMQKQKDRKDMMKQFCEWRIRHNDVKREVFTSNLAKRHYERSLSQKVWAAWHSVIENNWKTRVERACQAKAQEVCMQLTNDYEMKIASLNEELDNKRQEIGVLHSERDRYEEAMKKAFMRGVCALNLEAMNMFHGSEEEHSGAASGKTTSHDMYSDNLDGNCPQKEYGTSKNIPRDSTESLPPRIITSQGSRPHSTSQPRSVISKQSTTVTSSSSGNKTRPSIAKVNQKTSRTTTLGPTTLAPPMASVVVERHTPVNKQTIGQATASKYPKNSQGENTKSFKRLAGQTASITPHIQSVKVVD